MVYTVKRLPEVHEHSQCVLGLFNVLKDGISKGGDRSNGGVVLTVAMLGRVNDVVCLQEGGRLGSDQFF